MEANTSMPLSKDQKEYRRLRAWQLFEAGWKQADIARALGVTSGAVSQWIKSAKQSGAEALKQRKAKGPPSRLSAQQYQHLDALLRQGAEAFGFRGNVWTQARVAAVIKSELGVIYHPFHIYRVLRRLGWSQQKPERQATQRDAQALKEWSKKRWPALKQRR